LPSFSTRALLTRKIWFEIQVSNAANLNVISLACLSGQHTMCDWYIPTGGTTDIFSFDIPNEDCWSSMPTDVQDLEYISLRVGSSYRELGRVLSVFLLIDPPIQMQPTHCIASMQKLH
jgi:hypothetical protein